MSRKGVELPVNVLVIVAIAVIVLLGMIALYMAGTSGPVIQLDLQTIKNDVCGKVVNAGCDTDDCKNVKIVIDDEDWIAENITDTYFGGDKATPEGSDCLDVCGCL